MSGKIDINFLQVKKYYLQIKKGGIEKAQFTHSPFGKSFEKQTKTTEDQEKKEIDAIINQSRRPASLTNKDDDHKDNYKEIFE